LLLEYCYSEDATYIQFYGCHHELVNRYEISTTNIHDIWWEMIVEHFVFDLYVEFSAYDDELFFQILLGRNHITKLNNDDVN
jgi:hypothetical protein